MLGLAAMLLPIRGGAPQPGAGGHVGASGGARPKHQLTLGIGVKILTSKLVLMLSLEIEMIVPWLIP